MGSPRLVFNGVTLDFPVGLSQYKASYGGRVAKVSTSDNGVSETVVTATPWGAEFVCEDIPVGAFTRALAAWWSWASRGLPYAFARDSDKMIDAVLLYDRGSEAESVQYSGANGHATLNGGDPYLLRTKTPGTTIDTAEVTAETFELVSITEADNAGAPAEIFLILLPGTTLAYPYAAGDLLRDADYWPSVVNLDAETPFHENVGGMTVRFAHRFMEKF